MEQQNIQSEKKMITGIIIGIIIILFLFFFFWMLYLNRYKEAYDIIAKTSISTTQESSPTSQNIAITPTDHIKGNKNAPLVLVEFGDFSCDHCRTFHLTMEQIIAKYPNDIAWVYRHYPQYEESLPAALASECAEEQGKFWEYAHTLFMQQKDLNSAIYEQIAEEANLNVVQFRTCMLQERKRSTIELQYTLGQRLGVHGTPGNFINGYYLPGSLSFDTIEKIIQQY